MTRRWGGVAGTTAFRAEPSTAVAVRPSARQSIAVVAVLALVVGAVVSLSLLVRPDRARTFDLLHGSIFLADQVGPVAVDLPSGKPTLRLLNVAKQVGVDNLSDLSVVPAGDATVLVNTRTGEFNMAADTGFVVKHDGGGVVLARATTSTVSAAYPTGNPDDPGQAYIVRTGIAGTDVFLIDQGTVERAGSGQPATPQASTNLRFPTDSRPGAAVSVGGNLWLLGRNADGSHTVHELRVPSSQTREGVGLIDRTHGSVDGPAAIAATGGAVPAVAVASTQGVEILRGDGSTTGVHIGGLDDAATIVPASSADGRFVFLVRSRAGWSIVSVAADGRDLRGPTALSAVPANADLAAPAMSGGGVFTIDRSSGAIYRVGLGGVVSTVPGLDRGRYPYGPTESTKFSDAYVIAHGPRVFVDSVSHVTAVAIFTDGRLRSQDIVKGEAVPVSAAGGADALTGSNLQVSKGGKAVKGAPKPKNRGVAIDNTTDCTAKVQQQPHAPIDLMTVAGSRSVTVSWTYQLLDRQECFPSTYQLHLRALTLNTPAPAQPAPVDGRTTAILGGLYPNSKYTVSVTAIRNGVAGPASPEKTFPTSAEGPAAPTQPIVLADAAGNWLLHFRQGCTTGGCVPVRAWTVTAKTCGNGHGIVNPPPLTVLADPNVPDQPVVTYHGNDTLLGRGLQFTVTGVGGGVNDDLDGAPSAQSGCSYSHRPADVSALTLTASTPDTTAFGHDAAAKVSLDLGNNPVRALGGVGATVAFVLTGGGTTQQRSVVFDGTQSFLTATFPGVRAGASYRATVTVTPPSGGTPASVQSAPVSTRAAWPAVTLTASCSPASTIACDLHVAMTGISSAAADGEFFDFAGSVSCGTTTTATGITRTHFDPADTTNNPITVQLSQLAGLFGSCKVSGTLQESASDNHLFGGLPLTLGPVDVDLGAPATGNAASSDFTATFVDHSGAAVEIRYTGSNTVLGSVTTGWSATVSPPAAPADPDCNPPTQSQLPAPGADDSSAVYVPLSSSCVNAYGDLDLPWTLSLRYTDTLTGVAHTVDDVQFTGHPTGFQACAPVGFTAGWTTPAVNAVTVSSGGDVGGLSGCSKFTYQLIDPTGTVCTTAADVDPRTDYRLSCDAPDPSPGWLVRITWHDDVKNVDGGPIDIAVSGP